MRTFLIILVAIVILGGGWYFYSMQATPIPDMNIDVTPQQPVDTTPMQPATSTGTSTQGALKEITVTSTGMAFNQKTLTVKKGDRVRITYQNGGGTHDLRIDGYNVGTKVINGGQSETFEFVADRSGTFEYYCSVGNHRAQGMKGTLTVTP